MDNNKMPVAIITGFLGAGKTTLLNEILSRNPDSDFLIIEKSISDYSNFTIARPANENRHDIQTLSFTIPGDFKMDSLSWWLDNFLFTNASNILRIKGILSIENMQHKIVLQSVGSNFQVLQGTIWKEEEVKASRLVFIGSGLDKKELEKNLLLLRTGNKAKKMV